MDWEDSHSFGQRVPPLYVDIKEILQEYPDGQIFKVESQASVNLYTYAWLDIVITMLLTSTSYVPKHDATCCCMSVLVQNLIFSKNIAYIHKVTKNVTQHFL